MSTTVSAAFIKQYSDDVKHLYQQKGSKLRQAVRIQNGVTASTYDFHRLGSVNANTKDRHDDFTPLSASHDVVTATLTDHYAGDYVNDLDQLKTNINIKSEYVKSFANALGRKTDDIIIAELDAVTTADITTTTGALTYARLLEVLEKLNASDVDPEDRFLIVQPRDVTDALNINNLTSADYVTMRAIQGGKVESCLGFNWIMSTRLAANSVEKVIGMAKPAVGLAVGQDITTRADFSADKQETAVVSKMSMGAAVIDTNGIAVMDITS